MAEAFAVGLPVISNRGIGDVDRIISDVKGGILIDLGNVKDVERVCSFVGNISGLERERLRLESKEILGREVSARLYKSLYFSLDRNGE